MTPDSQINLSGVMVRTMIGAEYKMNKLLDDIIELNHDKEAHIIQMTRPGLQHRFGKKCSNSVPVSFVHASDIHNVPDLWDRMVRYINYYSDYISFAVHTGDYCGGAQESYTDMYEKCTPCVHPILNCVGNHDCVAHNDWSHPADKKITHSLLFNHSENWDADFADCEYPMSYYKDFPDSNMRLIVLDLYYDIWHTRVWLSKLLDDALEKGIHVVTAMHEPTDYIVDAPDVTFHHMGDYETINRKYELDRTEFSFDHRGRVTFEDVIADFIHRGGNYVCNLAGHDHIDSFGYTQRGVLNVVVENGTDWDTLGESSRIKGTRTYDCFNVVAIDTDLCILKLVRIGNNVEHYMREKNVLCFDYKNRGVIYNK